MSSCKNKYICVHTTNRGYMQEYYQEILLSPYPGQAEAVTRDQKA